MASGDFLFWAVVIIASLVACAAVAAPLFRKAVAEKEGEADLAFHRAQIEELRRDLERGLISEEQHAVAEAEIGRRLLSDTKLGKAGDGPAQSRRSSITGALVGLSIPVAAIVLYALIGNPGVPSQPFGARTDEAGREYQALVELGRTLEARLADLPDDRDTLIALAETRSRLRQFGLAADLYRRAVDRVDDDPPLKGNLLAAMAEMLILSADGQMVPAARQAVMESLRHNPDEPRARYYQGAILIEDGDVEGALLVWRRLRADSAENAPWLRSLSARIADAEARLASTGAAPALDPDAMSAMMALSEEERAEQIGQMVDGLAARLEENPEDVPGWLRLARAYGVMERHEEAIGALDRAAEQAGDADAQALDAVLRGYLSQAQAASTRPPEQAAVVAGRLYAVDPAHPGALWVLGDAARLAGERNAARGFFRMLLELLPENTPEQAEVQRQLDLLSD